MRIIAQMQIYQGFESKIKIALKMGKTILSAITESEGFEPSRRLWRLHTFQACSFGQLGQLSSTINM